MDRRQERDLQHGACVCDEESLAVKAKHVTKCYTMLRLESNGLFENMVIKSGVLQTAGNL
jgi:hypothetical protein